MSQQHWLDLGIWLTVIAASVQTVFVITYATRPWWKHYVGRALFLKSLSLAVALWISATNSVLDPYKHQLEVTVFALAFVAIAITYQTVALFLEVAHDLYQKKQAQRAEQEDRRFPPGIKKM